MKKKLITGLKVLSILAVLCLVYIFVCDVVVERATKKYLYDDAAEIPKQKVGLLLGTSKYLRNGNINLYYQYRIEAAIELYHAGKVDFILVSGDNATMSYNEPVTIKNDLVAGGIPENKIYLDYAGFRTLDSVVRCKLVFGQDSIIVISQPFHNKRAIYIARAKGIEATGYNARKVSAYYGFKTQVREKLARAKMMLDLATGKQPKFLGKKIEIR